MRHHLTCVLAAAAIYSLAACDRSGDFGSRPAFGLDDIRELTGLSAPIETSAEQQARQQDIVSRADSLVVSTMHTELTLPEGALTIRQVSECSRAECQLLDPTTGDTETVVLDTAVMGLGDAEAIGSAHGITLMSRTGSQMGVEATSLGAWMEHGSFALKRLHAVGEEVASDTLHAVALGYLTDRPLTGSASWLGIMVGTPVSGEDRGDRLVGTAALNYDMNAGALDAGFSGITNIDRGTAHGVEAVIFSDLTVGPDGTFARGQSGARIQGGFHGAGHAEAAGIFEHSDMIGAFGAKRQ
ncbi:MAG: hypothetical protein OXN97_11820 [Bryobacterales bacterium]|nr:hypothetical protein [Bryobacterales bacterium]